MLVLVSLLSCLFEDVNAQTTKNRYYKANDENVSFTMGRTWKCRVMSAPFSFRLDHVQLCSYLSFPGGELSTMKISDTGINYYNGIVGNTFTQNGSIR
ncbi:hypothetical protein NXW11_24635 [Bacteroides thetaiotaomicron]|uniref:hypothetical protein n=1 Tax=Bacteroides thetaiotaomicron TaxID=818 RepID=UPI0021652E82|nr:hypothetical protein [Bacteroides thetaiotaomicron]MCS2621076.1 hypothetical protein [Bacteroides thetaiotaomicron]